MTEPSDHQRLAAFLLELQGGDPFADVYRASNERREAHGPDWSRFAGPDWKANVMAYARKLAAHPALHTSFVLRDWLYGVALAVKLP